MRKATAAVLLALFAGACTTPTAVEERGVDESLRDEPGQVALDMVGQPDSALVLDVPAARTSRFPPAPTDVPTGPLPAGVQADLDEVVASFGTYVDLDVVRRLAATDDVRVLWPLAELLRFTQTRPEGAIVLDGVAALTGVQLELETSVWAQLTDHLLAWDLPTPPGYLAFKTGLLTQLDAGWTPFFADTDADVDWRQVAWGGVRLDDRPFPSTERCEGSCIPALDLPVVTDAAGGSWYPDDAIVFAVDLDGDARAYPKHLLEVHELVNDELGGRRIAVPYCTLCGSAQAYVTQGVVDGGEPLVLRTSGLLLRSNKLMMDAATSSMIDTFSGRALSGPLRAAAVSLEPIATVTTTWGEWKAAHPDTTILAEDPGTDRGYSLDPLGGRDDDGPIFPIGDVDPRLPAQASVVGVILEGGAAVAFDAAAARDTLRRGGVVELRGVRLVLDGGGLRAESGDVDALIAHPTHESFWFAWSQRHPATVVWTTER